MFHIASYIWPPQAILVTEKGRTSVEGKTMHIRFGFKKGICFAAQRVYLE
jgi:hypothetical protein